VDEAEVARRMAMAKYTIKVDGYLRLDRLDMVKCEKVFEKLYANMKRASRARHVLR